MSGAEGPDLSEVRHEAAARRFVAEAAGRSAVLDYETADGILIFTHTFVPPELRGRGLAEKLVRAGLAYARETGSRVRPDCSYVAAFIARHAEFRDVVAG